MKDQNDTYYDAATIHNISLATLHDEFATILTTEKLINDFVNFLLKVTGAFLKEGGVARSTLSF